jgi:hypothetical protein
MAIRFGDAHLLLIVFSVISLTRDSRIPLGLLDSGEHIEHMKTIFILRLFPNKAKQNIDISEKYSHIFLPMPT